MIAIHSIVFFISHSIKTQERFDVAFNPYPAWIFEDKLEVSIFFLAYEFYLSGVIHFFASGIFSWLQPNTRRNEVLQESEAEG